MKKINFISITIMMSVASLSQAQSPLYNWVKSLGGTSNEYVNSIVTDKNGNLYTTGSFEGTIDIDPSATTKSVTSNGGTDIFITKLDAKGNLLWSKNVGSYANDIGYSITLDQSGNVYATGSFQGSTDFGSSISLNAAGSEDIFIVKYDSLGNLKWVKAMGGYNSDYGRSIAADNFGALYITGKYQGNADFDPSSAFVSLYSAGGSEDGFIAKLDNNGNYKWVKSIGATGYDVGTAISVDLSGNVIATGLFNNSVNFDPLAGSQILKSEGLLDVYIAKYDSLGQYQWAKSFGGIDNDFSRGICTDDKGNVFTTGYFSGIAKYEPMSIGKSMSSSGGNDVFIVKLDKGGNLAWVNQLGGTMSDYVYAVSVDASGAVYTTGSFQGTADFDPSANSLNLVSKGGSDIFISKLDQNGNAVWAKSIGGISDDNGTAIAVLNNGKDVYTAGDYRNTVDFDPDAPIVNLSAVGSADVFIHKLSMPTSAISPNFMDAAISVYPNPTNGIVNLNFASFEMNQYLLSVFDIKGTQILNQPISNKETTIDLSNQAAGVYFVKLFNTETSSYKMYRIVKQ